MTFEVLRERGDEEGLQVTDMELFFDLVYVFAITQLSEFLFGHLTARGAAQALIMFGAVWWAWNYTAWATNWIDPARAPVALLMVVLMAFSLVMAAAIPKAFEGRGVPFAAAYVALQGLRSAFMVGAFGPGETMRRNYAQLLAWSLIAGAVWVAGALVHADARLIVWATALALDVGAPVHGFRLPGVGATDMEDWPLAGGHLAERCRLVLMIALGESVLRVGLTFSEQRDSAGVDVAFAAGFVTTVALWTTYFLRAADHAAQTIVGLAEHAGSVGRSAYAYWHAVMVAGVIGDAVATRAVIHDPGGPCTVAVTAVVLGGPGVYLAGLVMFKRATGARRPIALRPPLAGLGALALLVVVAAAGADRLTLSICVAVVLAALAISSALGRGVRRGARA